MQMENASAKDAESALLKLISILTKMAVNAKFANHV